MSLKLPNYLDLNLTFYSDSWSTLSMFKNFSLLYIQTLLSKVTGYSYIHTLTAIAVLGFSILPKETSSCRPGEVNQQPFNNKTLYP